MNRTEQSNRKNERAGRKVGLLFTVAAHAALFFVFLNVALQPEYSLPDNSIIVLDFQEPRVEPEPPKPIEVKAGNEPKAEVATPTEEVRLVQQAQAQQVGQKPVQPQETTMGNEGDIAKPEPPRPKPIDKRALFSAAGSKKKDTLAPQTAQRVSDALAAGHPQGNTRVGDTDGSPMARLKGRNTVGTLPFPEYTVNKAGKVVVKILVDQYGKVVGATPGVAGTTVQDKTLWEAAKEAALKAQFNVSAAADVVQEGTITYVFKLR